MTTIPTAVYQAYIERRTKQASVLMTPDSYQWYQEMHKTHRVYFDEARASWLVFGFADVQQVVMDTATFSSERTKSPDGKIDPVTSGGILGMDPPRHRQLRALISQAFTPRVIAQLEPRITALAHALLDNVQDNDIIDVVDDLAFPLPIMVIAELLGIPSSDRAKFRQWSSDVVGSDYVLRMATSQQIGAYFHGLIVQRTQEPQDDLISAFIRAEVDGEQLPEQDILGTCLLLLIAGHETTTGLLSNAIVCLDEHPDSLRQLVAQPDLLPSAIEEVLRYRAVVHTIPRVVTQDTVFGGQAMKAHDIVLPMFASANLDEAQFPDANRFDIQRTPNRHMGFGYGIHFCLGAALARLETRIMLEAMLERLPGLRRVSDVPLVLKPSSFIYGLEHLPITWKK